MVDTFSPLMAVGLGSVGTANNATTGRIIIEDLINVSGWDRNGSAPIVEIPMAAGYFYQMLHGALCTYMNRSSEAIDLIRENIQLYRGGEKRPIWKHHELMGWVASFRGNSTATWHATDEYPTQRSWICQIFNDKEEYLVAVAAYQVLLVLNEYSYRISTGKIEEVYDLKQRAGLDVPLEFLRISEEVSRRAYNLILQNKSMIPNIWRSLNVSDSDVIKHWEKWIDLSRYSSHRDSGFGMRGARIFYKDIFEDIGI